MVHGHRSLLRLLLLHHLVDLAELRQQGLLLHWRQRHLLSGLLSLRHRVVLRLLVLIAAFMRGSVVRKHLGLREQIRWQLGFLAAEWLWLRQLVLWLRRVNLLVLSGLEEGSGVCGLRRLRNHRQPLLRLQGLALLLLDLVVRRQLMRIVRLSLGSELRH